jgi:GDSL-like Lipase/Acylhydrolase family
MAGATMQAARRGPGEPSYLWHGRDTCRAARPLRTVPTVTADPLSLTREGIAASSASPRRSSRLRGALLNLVIAGGSLALALGMAELLVRLVAPQQLIVRRPDVWEAVDSLGWAHRPNVNTIVNTGERPVHVFTDRDGWRVGRAGRVEASKRILLLGDSFMEALQVEYEQSCAGLLEARLATRLGEPVAVRNTAVGGWDPPQYLLQARRLLGGEPYDLVLVSVFMGNDVVTHRVERYPPGPPVDLPLQPLRLPRHLTYSEFVNAVLYPINDFLKARSHLFVFLKKRAATLRMRAGLSADYFPDDLLRREASSPRWTVTAQILRDIRDLARAHKTPTLFALIPASFQVDTGAFQRALRGYKLDPTAVDLDQPERLLGDAMRGYGLDVIDLLPDFRRADRDGTRLYGTVDPHLSPDGHEVLERLLEPLVAARLSHAPGRVASVR